MFSTKSLSSGKTLPGARKETPGFNRFGADPNSFWGQLQRIPAKYYLECPVENVEIEVLKKRLKYIGIGENDFFIDYETRAAKQWFVNSLLIDKDFSSEGELESEPFENNKYYITLIEKDYQLSAFDRFNKKLFSLNCKSITKKELKKIRTSK